MKRIGFLSIGILLGFTLVFGTWRLLTGPYQYQGSLIDPPAPAADFALQDQHGGTFRLSDQAGRVTLIFFGYTHCPDVCPVTLSEFKQVKERLGQDADKVNFVFITIDPDRDTVQEIQKYLANFDPAFVGLTGDTATLQEVWRDYGVYQEKVEGGSAAGYLVDHTARVYAIDTGGKLRLTYPFGMEVEKLAEDVAHLVREG